MDFQQLSKIAMIRASLIEQAQKRMEKLIDYSIVEIERSGNEEPVGIQILACVLHLNFWVTRYAKAVGCTPQQAIDALMHEVEQHKKISKH